MKMIRSGCFKSFVISLISMFLIMTPCLSYGMMSAAAASSSYEEDLSPRTSLVTAKRVTFDRQYADAIHMLEPAAERGHFEVFCSIDDNIRKKLTDLSQRDSVVKEAILAAMKELDSEGTNCSDIAAAAGTILRGGRHFEEAHECYMLALKRRDFDHFGGPFVMEHVYNTGVKP